MKLKLRRVDFWFDEWLAGCVALKAPERGLYITACALIYSHSGPVPLADLKAAMCDHGLAFNKSLKILLSREKLTLTDGLISNNRCENELRKAVTRAENGPKNLVTTVENGAGKDVTSHENEARNDPQSHRPNGLDTLHARTRDRPRARSTNLPTGSELSDPQKVRESSEPSRLRAREGAFGGASHASAAPNHQSEAAAEAEKEARRQEGLRQALAMMPEYDAINAANEAEAKAEAEARWAAEKTKREADKKRFEELAINRAAEAEWRAEEQAKREGRPWPPPPEPATPPTLRVVIGDRDQKFDNMAAWVGLHMKDTDPRRPIWLKAIQHARATGDDTLIDDWDRLCQIQQADAAE